MSGKAALRGGRGSKSRSFASVTRAVAFALERATRPGRPLPRAEESRAGAAPTRGELLREPQPVPPQARQRPMRGPLLGPLDRAMEPIGDRVECPTNTDRCAVSKPCAHQVSAEPLDFFVPPLDSNRLPLPISADEGPSLLSEPGQGPHDDGAPGGVEASGAVDRVVDDARGRLVGEVYGLAVEKDSCGHATTGRLFLPLVSSL